MTNKNNQVIVRFDGKYLSFEEDGKLIEIPAISGNPSYQDPAHLTLDLDGDGVEMVPLDQSGAFFDLDNDGFRERC